MIDLYIDFKSPASYLALKPTLALAEELGVDIDWRPYNTKQEMVPTEKPNETKTETHIRIRAELRQKTHLRYATLQETPMTFREAPGKTDLALAALDAALQDDPLPFIQSAFHAYWVDGADLNDKAVVKTLLRSTGVSVSDEKLTSALESLPARQHHAEENGIVDAPAYVVDGQIFIGREHLPWIRSIISEKK